MKEVLLGGRRLKLDPAKTLGTGGEADVYDIGSGLALKIYKGPDHPDYKGLPAEQQAARDRLATRAAKLRDFPTPLPPRVVAPLETAVDRGGSMVGFSMRLIPGAEPLLRWAQPGFRQAVPAAAVAPLFLDLHGTLARLHEAGVVIGDFNDLNILVANGAAHLIDADSFQFGAYGCLAYTDRFVDPLCCADGALTPVRPHSPASDWYAFEVLLFQSLLMVHPYGGVLPGSGARPSERMLKRVTVLDPRVRVPKSSLPWKVLPDEWLHRFHDTFAEDQRSAFPMGLLESLRWTLCPGCRHCHARDICPDCAGHTPQARRELITVHGRVTATRLILTEGKVVAVGPEGWLIHEGGEFKREDGRVVLRGNLRPGTRYFLKGRSAAAVRSNETYACAGGRAFWERDGALWGEGNWGDERVGEVLAGQTHIWAGPAFGFGFYRAGGVTVAFVFDAQRRGLLDGVPIPAMRGRILDANCVFGDGRAWLVLALESQGSIQRRCVVITKEGRVTASADSPSWLESADGICAAGPHLFVPTDKGLIRVEDSLARAVEFPETEPFIDAGSLLAVGSDGLIVANRREILKLKMRQEVPV